MSDPQWYREAVARVGEKINAGTITEEEAVAVVAAEMARHPEFTAAMAARAVTRWTTQHGQVDLFHETLFPAIPAFMTVSPGVKMRTADMTADDLQQAWVMTVVRTRNVERAAHEQRSALARFRKRLIPLLKDGKTVGQVMPLLAEDPPAQAGAAA